MPSDRPRFFKVEPLEKRLLLSATPMLDTAGTEDEPEVLEAVVLDEPSSTESGAVMAFAPEEPVFGTLASSDSLTPDQTEESDWIYVNSAVFIDSGETWLYRATGSSIWFTQNGSVNGSNSATDENVMLESAVDILMEGKIGILSPVHHLVVSAGENIVFKEDIRLTGDLIIEAGASVVFERSVRVGGNVRIGDAANLSAVGSVQFQGNALLNVGGTVEIYAEGNVSFNANVGASTQPDAMTIVSALGSVSFNAEIQTDALFASGHNVSVSSSILVNGNGVTSNPFQLTAANSLVLGVFSSLTVNDGGMILIANQMAFNGGPGSITSIGGASNLVIKPYDSARIIGVAEASGNQLTRLDLSSADVAAIAGNFDSVVIGDAVGGTGQVRIGAIGLTQSGGSAQILNPTTFVGGSILVEAPVDVTPGAEVLRLVALQGDVVINGTINSTIGEQGAWVRMEAQGDILVNRTIFATDRISATAGYSDETGSVIVDSSGMKSGALITTTDAGSERRIELSSGDTSGNILFYGNALDPIVNVFGADGEIVLRARGGAITQTGGLLVANVLAAVANADITLRTSVDRVGSASFGGQALLSGFDEVIDGIQILGTTGVLTLLESDDLTLDRVATGGGDVIITTVAGGTGDLRLGILTAVGGNFSLQADGAIIDYLAGLSVVNLATAGTATLVARLGIGGASEDDIDTDVAFLSATNAVSGGIYIEDRGDLSITGDGITTLAGDGNIAVTTDGALTLEDGADVRAHGNGHVLLDAGTTLDIGNAVLDSTSGVLTVQANGQITFDAGATLATADTGSILVRSTSAGLTMDADATVTATDANLRIETALTALLGQLAADHLAIVSGGSVFAATGAVANVISETLRIEAAGAVGAVASRLRTEVGTLAVQADGTLENGIYVSQSGDLVVASVAPVAIETFAADETLAALTDATALNDLTADSNGDVIVVVDGALDLEDGSDLNGVAVQAIGSGSVYLETSAVNESITARASVLADTGALTVRSGGAIALESNVAFASTGGAAIVVEALGGALTMDGATASIQSDGAVVLSALEDIELAAVVADQADISSNTGFVLNADGASLNVVASSLALQAALGIGVSTRALITDVDILSAQVTGSASEGIFITERCSVLLAPVTVAGDRFGEDGLFTAFSQSAQDVIAESGRIELIAQDDLVIGATARVWTLAAGETIELAALDGALTMVSGAHVQSKGGNIGLVAEWNVALSIVDAQGGDIAVVSVQGAVTDNLSTESPNLITSGTAFIHAATGIGATGAGDLNTEVGELFAVNSTSGLIVITESTDLTAAGLLNNGSDGSILLQTLAGSLTLDGPTYAAADGSVLLRAGGADSDLTVNDTVTAAGGAVSLEAAMDLNVNAAVTSLASGTLDLLALGGDIVFAATGRALTLNQNIRIEAAGDAALTGIDAGLADVSVTAVSISDAGDEVRDIVASGLRINAGGDIGAMDALDLDVDTLALRALSGSVNLSNLNDLRIDVVDTVEIRRVLLNNATTGIAHASKVTDVIAAGDITIVSENGSVEVRELAPDGVAFGGDSVAEDQASDASIVELSDAPTVGDTIRQIGGFGIALEPGTGYAGPAFTGGAQSVFFDSVDSGIVGALVRHDAAGDFIRLEASKPENLGVDYAAHLNAFVLFETGRTMYSDLGALAVGTAGGMSVDTGIRFMLETTDGRFFLSDLTMAGAAGAGSLTMADVANAQWAEFTPDTAGDWRGDYDSLTFDQTLDPFEVIERIGVFASRSVASTDIGVNGVLTVRSFDVVVRESLRQENAIDSVDGNVTLTAAQDIFQNASIRTAHGSRIDLTAQNSNIIMDDGVLTSGSVADISYQAAGDVALSTLQSGSGNITVDAGDRISDNRVTDDANLVTPALVTLSAVNGIGVFGSGDILTDIGSLTAINTTSGDIVIRELDGLIIAPGGVTTLVGDSSVIITAEDGDFIVNGPVSVSGAGRLLLNALGTSAPADLSVNATIETASGSVSLLARTDLSLSDSASATVLSGTGTIDVQAINGLLTMEAGASLQTDGSNIRLLAQQSVTLGVVDARTNVDRSDNSLDGQAGWGDLTVRSISGTITDARDRTDGSTALFADAARFLAANGIGQTGAGVDNALNLEATLLAASTAAGVINILEASTLVVGTVASVSVDRVDADATVFAVADAAALLGLTTSGLTGGAIIVRTEHGSLTVDNWVNAAGDGVILLQASGMDSDVLLNANVLSATGPISVQAADSLTLAPAVLVQTGGIGSIELLASEGSVAMADTARALAGNGSVRIEAGADILLSNAQSSANVALIAGGSVLDNGNTHLDVVAAGLLIQAGVGAGTLGVGANALEISVSTLTARAGAGGVNLRETNAMTVGQLAVTVNRVNGDAVTSSVATGDQAGVRTTDNGSVVIRLSDGHLTLAHTALMGDQVALYAHGSGNVLLETLGTFTNILLSGGIETGGGHVSLVATNLIRLNTSTQVVVDGTGDVAVFAGSGGIEMNGSSRIQSASGHIRLSSDGEILVGGIETAGTVSLISSSVSILNNSTTQINVTADALRLWAGVGVGAIPLSAGAVNPLTTSVNTLSALAGFGSIAIEEVDGVTIDDVAITVHRVAADAATSTVSDAVQSDVRTQINNRHIMLRALAGDIVLNAGSTGTGGSVVADNTSVATVGSGRILIDALTGDVIANANVSGVAGHLSVLAGESVRFAANANLITGDSGSVIGTLYVEARNGNVEQLDGSQFIATLGDIRLAAAQDILLANATTTAKVSLIADAGSILDAGDSDIDVSAAQLRLIAGTGIGEPTNLLNTSVEMLSARAGGGGVFIEETDALVIDDTSATVQRYNPDNTLTEVVDATLSDVRTLDGDGSIVLRTLAGDLTLNDGSALADNVAVAAHGAGNIRLEAAAANTDLLANADILSGSGHITLLAARDLRFIADADVISGGAGTLNLEAGTGVIEMNDRTLFSTGSGDIRLLAADDILLGGIETTGNVSLTSGTGSIFDNGDFYTDVIASGLRMVAAVGIGSLDPLDVNAIETRVGSLSARATSGGINILEETALTVDDVAVTVERIGTDALGTSTTDATQSDVRTTAGNGSIILRTEAGDITLNDGSVLADLSSGTDNTAVLAHGSGNVLIEAIGAATHITANADLLSGDGHISLLAHGDVNLTATADVITGGTGTVFLEAKNGDVTQADNSRLIAADGDVRIWALNTIVLGGITTNTNASLIAVNGSILDAGDLHGGEDVIAAGLRMEAGIGIGAPADRIETRVDVLSARATSGGIFIEETDALIIDGVAASIERVGANAETATESDALQSDVRTTSGDGSIVIRTLGGHLTLNDGAEPADNTVVSAYGAGNIRLEAAGADTDLLANADILSGSGHITLMAQRTLQFIADADVTTGDSGTIHIVAELGSVEMDDNVLFSTGSGDVRIAAGTDVLLGGISTTGNVSLIAVNGSILDNGDTYTDVIANGLSMNAGTGVGELGLGTDNAIDTEVTTLSARATSGGVNVLEANALIVDAVEITVQSVGIDAGLTPTLSAEQTGVFTESSNGSIVLQTLAGDIILNDGSGLGAGTAVSAHGTGNVLVGALGADTNITLNSDLLSGTGHINLIATNDVALTAGSAVTTGGIGSVFIEATTGDFTQHDDSRITSADADVRVLAAGNIHVGGITTDANVSLIAQSGSILDSGDAFGGEDIIANQLSLRAAVGIGLATDALEIDVNTLSARATSGGIFLLESTAVTVGDTSATVRQILADATLVPLAITDAVQSDLRTNSGNGAVVLQSLAGDIILNAGSAPAADTAIAADGSGNVLVEALGEGTDVTVNADVLSGSGHVNVLAAGDVTFTNTADVRTGVLGTIFVQAVAGSVTMADQSLLQSVDGDIRVFADLSITVGGIATVGNVSLIATNGSVLDGGDHYVDVVADQLRLAAGTGIGTAANALETTVATLSARATSGGVFILETDALTIDDTTATVQRVAANASISGITDAVQSDVRTTALDGSIVLRTSNGDIVLNAGTGPDGDIAVSAHGAGNVLVETLGAATSIAANADVLSGSGHVSVIAAGDVDFTGTADIQTAGNGTVFVHAAAGSVVMSDTSQFVSLNGDVRVLANGSITLGGVSTSANVSLIATNGSILDGGDSFVDVTANQLRMVAGIGVGASSNALETNVAVISARATSGGIFILESDSITVDDTSATIQRVEFNAGVSEITDGTQSDLRTTAGNGAIVLRTTNGDITLNDGTAPQDVTAISAHGSGNVLIDALADDTDIFVNADILSGTGHIFLRSGGEISVASNVSVVTDGIIQVDAGSGSFVMGEGVVIDAGSENIRIIAGVDILLGELVTSANISLIADTGSILNNTNLIDGLINLRADSVRMVAGAGIGALGADAKAVTSTIDVLAAQAAGGGINLLESNSLTVDSVAVTYVTVNPDGATASADDAALADVRTLANNGSIVLRTIAGDLILNDGTPAEGTAVSAHGAGNVRLEAGATYDLIANADVLSAAGHISLYAGQSILFASNANAATGGAGTLTLEAINGAIEMHDTARFAAVNGDIILTAHTDILVGGIETLGNVALTATNGAVLDNGDTYVDVSAAALRLWAYAGVGSLVPGSVNPLDTEVGTLSAVVNGGGINILEATSVTVGAVSATTQSVGIDAESTVNPVAAQSDLRSTGGDASIVLRTVDGSVILTDGDADGIAVEAYGSGAVLIEARGDGMTVQAEASILSGSGDVSVLADSVIDFSATADIATGSTGDIFVDSTTRSVLQADGSHFSSASGNIRVSAHGIIRVGKISTQGDVSLISQEASIIDGGDLGGEDVVAGALRLWAANGIGAAADHLEINATSLSAVAGAGGIFLLESSAITVQSTEVSVRRVDADAASSLVTDAAQMDVRTIANGSIVLQTVVGTLSLVAGNDVSADGTGRVLLQTGATGGDFDLQLNGSVLSGSGAITVLASGSLGLSAAASVLTSGEGFVNLEARGQDFVQADGSRIGTGTADVRIFAARDLRLANVSTAGNVALIAETGSVLDNGNTHIDVVAEGLRVTAAVGIGSLGSGTAPITTTVNLLSARAAADGVNIRNTNALIVGSVAVAIQRVTDNADLGASVADAALESVRTTSGNGAIVLETLIESLTLNGAAGDGIAVSAHGSGNILLRSGSIGLHVNGDVLSSSGHLTLEAATSLHVNNSAQVATAGAGTIDLRANAGSITVDTAARVQAVSGAIRLQASDSIILDGVVRTDANASLIATTGSITGGSSAGVIDVEAAGLRLVAGHGVGTSGIAGHALETQVSSISGRAHAGGIRILNVGDLEVAPVAVTVQRVDVSAASAAVTDAAQNDLETFSGGSLLVEVAGGALTTNGEVASRGIGPVRLAASNGMTLHRGVWADNASVTLLSPLDIIFTTAGRVEVGGSGSIFIESDTGAITMAEWAQLRATNGNIRLSAQGDLTLGGLSTGGMIGLISTNGSIVSDGSVHGDIAAAALRLEAGGAGTAANALNTRVDVLAAQVGPGGLYLDDASALLVGTVGLTTDQVLSHGSLLSVIDSELSGVVANGGPVVLSSVFNLSLSTVTTDLSATLTSHYGAILNAGTGSANAQVGGTLTLSGESGLGRTGSGALVIDASTLTVDNHSGSIYLKLLSAVELAGATITGPGDLYLNQTAGGLQVTAPVWITNGRAVLNVAGALQVDADVRTGRDLRIVADSLAVTDSQLTADTGNIVIRTLGDAFFDATSGATATSGTLAMVTGGTLTVGDFVAETRIDLRAQGSILRAGGELTAPAIRLYSETGDLGASEAPLMTNTDRIDLHAAGNIYISEAGGVQIGRSGLTGGGNGPDDTITINLGDGTLSSATDSIKFDGDGTFIVNSSGELVLGTKIHALNGNVTLNAEGVRDGTIDEGLLLEVRNGRLSIFTLKGIGGPGNADIEIAAKELTAGTQTGDLQLEVDGTTRLVADGLYIVSGSGTLHFNSIIGSLQADASITHGGSGNLLVHVNNGGVTMASAARMQTNSGLLDLRASGNIILSRISTTSGNITAESTSESIRRITGFSGPNIVSSNRPTVKVAKIAQVTVDSSSVHVVNMNTGTVSLINRGTNQTYIFVDVNFS